MMWNAGEVCKNIWQGSKTARWKRQQSGFFVHLIITWFSWSLWFGVFFPLLKFIFSIKTLHSSIETDSQASVSTTSHYVLFFFSHLFLIFAYRSSSWTEFSVVFFFSSYSLIYSENSRLKQKTRFTSLIFINIHNTLYSTFSPCQFNDSSYQTTLFPEKKKVEESFVEINRGDEKKKNSFSLLEKKKLLVMNFAFDEVISDLNRKKSLMYHNKSFWPWPMPLNVDRLLFFGH